MVVTFTEREWTILIQLYQGAEGPEQLAMLGAVFKVALEREFS